ncbi:MAG: hypothetical protein NZ903_00425, partial [Candidatus Micrarchaeota archaeon]|nr:hypothetical protein [Candidatus Micrarchaeota archaeon]
TTPKVRGVKPPKVQKMKFSGRGKVIAFTAATIEKTNDLFRRWIWKGNLNFKVLKSVNAMEKYLSPDERKEINSLYRTTPLYATVRIAEKTSEVRPRLVEMIGRTNRKMESAQKAKEKLAKLKEKAKTESEQLRIREAEKKIDEEIMRYAKQIREYEEDLRAMSSDALISSIGLRSLNLDTFKETKDTIDRKMLSSLIQYIENPSSAKLNIKEIKEYVMSSTHMMGIKDMEAEKRVNLAFLAKIELDRLYIAEAMRILNIISNKLDLLSEEEKAKYYKIFDISEPEKERLKHIKELFENKEIIKESIKDLGLNYYINELNNKLNSLSPQSEEYKKLKPLLDRLDEKSDEEKIKELAEIHHQTGVKLHDSFLNEIAKARESINRSINNFYSAYERYSKKETPDIEQAALKAIIEFGVMSKKGSDYFSDIYSGSIPYGHHYPELDRESAKKVFDIIAAKYDPEIVFDLLYSVYISPFTKEQAVEFSKERIGYFEDEAAGRTVFDQLFKDIWYLRRDPNEEYYNLDMKLISYYGVKKALQKMEAKKVILQGEPDCEGKKAALDYAEYFIRTYSPSKLGYEEKKLSGHWQKKQSGYEQRRSIGYEEKKRETSKEDKEEE